MLFSNYFEEDLLLIAEVFVLTDARLSHDVQPSFISIHQMAAASFTVQHRTECTQTHRQTDRHTHIQK